MAFQEERSTCASLRRRRPGVDRMPEHLEPGVDKVGELGRGWVAQGFMYSVSVGSLSLI